MPEDRDTRRLAAYAVPAAVALALFWVALKGGSYALTVRNPLGIAAWVLVGVGMATAFLPRTSPPRPAAIAGGLLTAFAALTALSMAWADSAEKAFTEFNRVSLYLAIFALVVLAARRASAWQWTSGLAVGIAAVGLLALCSRLFPGPFPESDVVRLNPDNPLLSYPLNYWNGVAVLVALGLPLLLAAAIRAPSPRVAAAAIAPIPALAGTIYLTSSRGGVLVTTVAVLAFLALAPRRIPALAATIIAAVGAAIVIVALNAHTELVNGPLQSDAIPGQGRTAAVFIVAACAVTAVAHAFVRRRLPSEIGIGPSLKRGLVALGVVVVVAGLVAADPPSRLDSFQTAPERFTKPRPLAAEGGESGSAGPAPAKFGKSYVQSHILNSGGSGRWQFWESAVDEFETRPLFGRGAGSYAAWWAQHGSLYYSVQNAHSLFFDVLGELGAVGLLLLLGALATGLWAAAGRLRSGREDDQLAVAALTATLVAYTLASSIDWIWRLPAVGGIGIVCLALLTGPATAQPDSAPEADGDPPGRGRRQVGWRVAAALVALVAVIAQAVPLNTALKVRDSERALGRDDAAAALDHAEDARKLQDWAASPHLQLALAEEQQDRLAPALESIRDAIERDPSDWRFWAVASRIEQKSGDLPAARASFQRALDLNPRSPVLRAATRPGEKAR